MEKVSTLSNYEYESFVMSNLSLSISLFQLFSVTLRLLLLLLSLGVIFFIVLPLTTELDFLFYLLELDRAGGDLDVLNLDPGLEALLLLESIYTFEKIIIKIH